MKRQRFRTIGVLGGLGPEAGTYLLGRIVRVTAAAKDQDHPPVLLFSLPQVPDRTPAILGHGASPVPAILRGLRTLERAGADFAVIACVSAHYFLPWIASRSPLPLVSLIDETLAAVRKMRPAPRTLGLLATTGTVRSGIIAKPFKAAGLEVLVPSARDQRRVMAAIYGSGGIKGGVTTGPPRETLVDVASELVRRGAEAVVAGCTEVPLVLQAKDLPVPLVDPMTIAARAVVERAGGRLKRR
jgi:aspartate racemase